MAFWRWSLVRSAFRPGVRSLVGIPAALLAGCGATGPVGCDTAAAAVQEVEADAVRILVRLVAPGADSVLLRFRTAAGPLETSASFPVVDDTVTAAALGLYPETAYDLEPALLGHCGAQSLPGVAAVTTPLPADLPHFTAAGSDPSPGYVVLAAGGYGLVIDNDGRVVWYHHFPAGPGLNFQAQPNGRFLALPPSGPQSTGWLEVDPLGRVTRTLPCARGLQPRFHDALVEPDGGYWVMCDETRVMDFSWAGKGSAVPVTGTVVQRIGATGSLRFEWSAFDHFDPADQAAQVPTNGQPFNWTHGNAFDVDQAGTLLVSFRNLGEVTAIDVATGAVRWRFGGGANQFGFDNFGLPFLGQHGVRWTGPGEFVVLDNLGDAAGSRTRRFRVDSGAGTARLVATYTPLGFVVARLGGTTQPLPGGRTLTAYGNGAAVEEYDGVGQVVWRLLGDPGYLFRAQRIGSLYHPGAGTPR